MRIRSIKPSFFVNDELGRCDPRTRLLFIGLWCAADCEGRLLDRPARLRMEILPYDDVDMEVLLGQLCEGDWIRRYEVAGVRLIQVTKFRVHQRISGKELERKSEYPPPPDGWAPPEKKPRGRAPHTPGQRVYEKDLDEHGATHAAIGAGGDRGTPPPPVVAPPRDLVLEVLEHLNAAVGRSFRPVESNLKFIRARLKEDGVTFEGIVQMIDRQVLRWKGTDQAEYLRPETLFNATKFQGYYAAKDEPIHEGARVQNAGRFNPNAQLAGGEVDEYAVLGRTIGASPDTGAGVSGPAPAQGEPPAYPPAPSLTEPPPE
jgi:uncharacterized phage protein (TIGR02220 family)